MKTIVVSGKAKSVGKTSVMGAVINNLNGDIAAIKVSFHNELKEEVVTDTPSIVYASNTDTELFASNGADKVVFVRTDNNGLKGALGKAIELCQGNDYLLIEGNSVLDFIRTNLVIYIDRDGVEMKESAIKARDISDIIINYDNIFTAAGKVNLSDFTFNANIDSMSCSRAHLISSTLGIKLSKIGKKLNKEGIKINKCQLGLF